MQEELACLGLLGARQVWLQAKKKPLDLAVQRLFGFVVVMGRITTKKRKSLAAQGFQMILCLVVMGHPIGTLPKGSIHHQLVQMLAY